MYLIYNLLLWPAALLLIPWVGWRILRRRLPGLPERLGFISPDPLDARPVIWLHAVSLGEVKAAAPLLSDLRAQRPEVRFVVTTSTRTGAEAARDILSADDVIFFPPFDIVWICRRFVSRIRPDALVVMETELWPNLFREAKRAGIPLLVVNGRISDHAFPRYHASCFLWRRVLEHPDAILAQSNRDVERFIALGAPAGKVTAAGNLKYAVRPSISPIVARLRLTAKQAGAGPILVAGSTMPGEEAFLLAAFRELRQEFPRLWMILAPRHPERFAAVAHEIRSAGIAFERRSALTSIVPGNAQARAALGGSPEISLPGILLLDSVGELDSAYDLADVAFVGGTLVPTGGHNILEPARFGKAILIGPSMSNFQDIANAFLQDVSLPGLDGSRTGAAVQILNASTLAPALRYLFKNPALRRRLGEAARSLVESELNPLGRIREELERLMSVRCAPKDGADGPVAVPAATTAAAIEPSPLHEARE